MKFRLPALILVAIAVPACLSSEPRGTTTFVPGGSTTLKAVMLSGRQEVPPVGSSASGNATLQIDPGRMFVTVTVEFSGLTNPTEAHIHLGEVGVDGPILFPLASGPYTSPLVVTLSQADLAILAPQGSLTFSDAVDAILEGRTYVNLHTAAFPDGEIRGQVGPVTMLAQLDGLQEVPPVVTAASGSMSLAISSDQSSMTFTLDVPNLPNLTEAHIHVAPAEVFGPILFTLATGPQPASISGTLTAADFTPQPGAATFEEAIDAVLSGNTYVNVHTGIHPDGEIRGQILGYVTLAPPPVTGPPPTTVPPPTTINPPPSTTIIVGPYGARK